MRTETVKRLMDEGITPAVIEKAKSERSLGLLAVQHGVAYKTLQRLAEHWGIEKNEDLLS